MFNYSTATDDELLQHISLSSSASVSVAKRYHKSKENFHIVERINKARMVLKQKRVLAQLEQLEKDSEGFGL